MRAGSQHKKRGGDEGEAEAGDALVALVPALTARQRIRRRSFASAGNDTCKDTVGEFAEAQQSLKGFLQKGAQWRPCRRRSSRLLGR